MPTPSPELLEQLEHLPAAEQLAWLDRWSRALLEGQEPPPGRQHRPQTNQRRHLGADQPGRRW